MTGPVTALSQTFDPKAIMRCLPVEWKQPEFQNTRLQLAITHSQTSTSWFDGIGSTYDAASSSWRSTGDYTILNSHFHGTYMEEVFNALNAQAAADGTRIGRVRLLLLRPRTCYSWHKDPDEFRYHIPLITFPSCLFLVGDRIHVMPTEGQLYTLRTNEFHSAMNGHKTRNRYHLVFDTW